MKRVRRIVFATGTAARPGDDALTLALGAATVTASAGMTRLFTSAHPIPPVLATAVIAHAVAWATRRSRLRWLWGSMISLSIVAVVAADALFHSTTRSGIPTPRTASAAAHALGEAGRLFFHARTPVTPLPGYTMIAMAAVWIVAMTSDIAAMRLRLVAEGLLPSAALVVFTGAMTDAAGRMAHLATYAAAAAAVAVLANRRLRSTPNDWFGARLPSRPVGLIAGVGVALVAAAAAAALPHVPGVTDRGAITWRDGDRKSKPRTTISPLVSVRSRLVNQSDRELFTVRAAEPAYWRLVSLDRFDGAQWSGNGRYRKAGSNLPGSSAASHPLVQEFRITGLASDWLPAAYRAVRVDGPTGAGKPSFDTGTGSLLAAKLTGVNLSYRVESAVPDLSAASLGGADAGDGNIDLPDNFSPRVRLLAQQLTADAPTPLAKAIALQQFFRTSFLYDITVPPPSGPTSVEDFVFNSRRGYCEQFSSAFAAMARSIGLPARVAVGFTPGVQRDGVFTVAGRDAHAWPEVLLKGVGWIAFEPTPGRAIPGAQGYTGVPYEAESPETNTPTTAAPPVTTSTPVATTAPPRTDVAPSPAPSRHRSSRFALLAILVLAGLAALLAILLIGAASARRFQRRRRLHEAGTVDDWELSLDELSWLGVAPLSSETGPAFAARAAAHLDDSEAGELALLARAADAACFAESPVLVPHSELPARLRQRSRQLSAATRVRRMVDPRVRPTHHATHRARLNAALRRRVRSRR